MNFVAKHLKPILKDHADRLRLGKKANLDFQDWKNLRDSLVKDQEAELVYYLDNLIDEQEFESLVNNFIYG
jgi:hypothetical protein